jgi:hypothetical protein
VSGKKISDRSRFNSYIIYYKGKVAIGKARYLLNIVYLTLGCSNHLFSEVIINIIQKSFIYDCTIWKKSHIDL